MWSAPSLFTFHVFVYFTHGGSTTLAPAGLTPHYPPATHTPLTPTALTTNHGPESAAPEIAIVVGHMEA
ncbi:hypothetical protein O988_07738 [Pseudogymnoascus sp. VKM F-3808]|nr:hypothetical protein O988_07738 [Pseudogymnoascus sp. VKM F-3808]